MEPLAPQQSLGPFRLDERIAVGGMAEVWRAEGPEGPLALKVLKPGGRKERELREMFIDEARIARRLRHPNVARVYDVHEQGPYIFQSMELIAGRDLRRLLSALAQAKVVVPVAVAVRMIREAARGLRYAHLARDDHGVPLEVVHRDVSPHNLMITNAAQVKLLDFGIARARERLHKTRTGVIKGKLSYMAPEQALAQPVSPRTDIYALGVVLWEVLALRKLFRLSSDAEMLREICESTPPKLSTLRPDIPESVHSLVDSMLEKHPKHRPASMRAVEDRLTACLFKDLAEDELASAEGFAKWLSPWLGRARRKTAVLDERTTDDLLDARSTQRDAWDDTVEDPER